MNRVIGLLLALLPSLLWADGVRCGAKIITVGDASETMHAACGEPAQISRYLADGLAGGVRAGVRPPAATEPVEVEIWTFNFGPDQLMQRVRVENGVVVRIDSLGYGHN